MSLARVIFLVFMLLGGCVTVSERVREQSLAAGMLAGHYHSVHGTWPETLPELVIVEDEQFPLDLREDDQVYLRQNSDGSATITWVASDGMASYRVAPPARRSEFPLDGYALKETGTRGSFGKRLE